MSALSGTAKNGINFRFFFLRESQKTFQNRVVFMIYNVVFNWELFLLLLKRREIKNCWANTFFILLFLRINW